jgi:excisionase family DNA binding protein
MDKADRLYTVAEALPLLGVKLTKFYALLEEGKLQAIKLDAKTLISEGEILRFRASLPVIGRKAEDKQPA